MLYDRLWGFPVSSAGKESVCNAGDPGSIAGLGKCPGEGIDYPLQYSWASLVAQTVKNPPAVWETLVQSVGWEDPLEGDMATHSRILAWRILMDRGVWRGYSPRGRRIGHDWATKHIWQTLGPTSSAQYGRSVVSDSLRPHEPQHARPPRPSPTPGACSNSCPSSQWRYPPILKDNNLVNLKGTKLSERASSKRLDTIWFHLHNILETIKL